MSYTPPPPTHTHTNSYEVYRNFGGAYGKTDHGNFFQQAAAFELKWREGERAPSKIDRPCDAVIIGTAAYFRGGGTKKIYSYDFSSDKWSQLLDTPFDSCTLAVVNNLLTTIGGSSPLTNELFSLTGQGKDKRWTKEFPPMPTKRRRTIALCSEKALIVAGGDKGETLRTVEIMNTETLTWSTVADLPQELRVASATITGGCLYILGGVPDDWTGTHAVYTCSVSALIRSCSGSASSSDVWERIADIPVTWATCVSIQNRVLAVGGRQPNGNFSTAVHMYDPDTNFWQVISHMSVARRQCFAVVLPTTRALMVVGGWSATTGNRIDSVELASIIKE